MPDNTTPLEYLTACLRERADYWKAAFEESDLDADYGRWDGWENAWRYAVNASKL